MHDIEIPAQKQHAHNGAPGSPIEKKCHFFPRTQLNKSNVLIMKIMINCTEWPLNMCVRKFCMHYILNQQFWLNISRVMLKSVRQELTFLVECRMFWITLLYTIHNVEAIEVNLLYSSSFLAVASLFWMASSVSVFLPRNLSSWLKKRRMHFNISLTGRVTCHLLQVAGMAA